MHAFAMARPKVVFVLGATATGKSKLAIALSKRFDGEVINADKIQVYAGLPVITNKVTDAERAGVPHHLLGVIRDPGADYAPEHFRRDAAAAVAGVLSAGRLPVVAGGSNGYVEALVKGAAFRRAHDALFLWLDAEPRLLEWHASARVDDMVRAGAVAEARAAFHAGDGDYTRGVRRAIGLAEMHGYQRLLAAAEGATDAELAGALARALQDMKDNTARLARAQSEKLRRLSRLDGWDVRRVDVTPVLLRMADGEAFRDSTWEKVVWEPCEEMVRRFLGNDPTPRP
ncbi:hypothetical protein EJB05_51007, partial [Eragrostis curvula]